MLDGCVNFRDLGGYHTVDGHQTRWRRLFRADGLNRLSPDDRAQLRDMGLATVIDLRTVDEGEQRGSFPVDEVPVQYHSLPLSDVLPSPEELAAWDEASYVASHYFDLVVGRGAVLAQAIKVLADGGALPAVVHCSAGKDRTGVLSALILAFLGVPDETIVEDYALSAPAMVLLFERLKGEYPDSVEIVTKMAPAIIQVAPETMANLLEALRSEYGSYDGLAEHLGVSEAVARLRPTLLEAV
ncbi:MAG TPA: tyrosine-protein phosphatase [Acidimicrobiales bacterium]|nr:tyrosine-protein phosphatase [Acidimicrobiales bacterium]